MTVAQWLSLALETMANDSNAKQEAIWTLEHFTQLSHAQIKASSDLALTQTMVEQLTHALHRRSQGEPLAYILGTASFWTLELTVSPAVLIPRLETEMLVEWAIEKASEFNEPAIADLGTGSGAIALALAKSLPTATVLGVDISEDALAIARENQIQNRIQNVEWVKSFWFNDVPAQRFELIISNPPYIDPCDDEVDPSTTRYEPHLALFADQNGLTHIQHILDSSRDWLASSGWVAIEHGHRQGPAVRTIASDLGYQHIETHQDLNQKDRFTVGVWTGSGVK